MPAWSCIVPEYSFPRHSCNRAIVIPTAHIDGVCLYRKRKPQKAKQGRRQRSKQVEEGEGEQEEETIDRILLIDSFHQFHTSVHCINQCIQLRNSVGPFAMWSALSVGAWPSVDDGLCPGRSLQLPVVAFGDVVFVTRKRSVSRQCARKECVPVVNCHHVMDVDLTKRIPNRKLI